MFVGVCNLVSKTFLKFSIFVYMLSTGNHDIGLSVIYYVNLHQLCGVILFSPV